MAVWRADACGKAFEVQPRLKENGNLADAMEEAVRKN